MNPEQDLLHFFAFCLQTLSTCVPKEELPDADAFLAERIGETYMLFTQREIGHDDAVKTVIHFFEVCSGVVDIGVRWKEWRNRDGDIERLNDAMKRITIDG